MTEISTHDAQLLTEIIDMDLLTDAINSATGQHYAYGQTSIVTANSGQLNDPSKAGFVYCGSEYHGRFFRDGDGFNLVLDRVEPSTTIRHTLLLKSNPSKENTNMNTINLRPIVSINDTVVRVLPENTTLTYDDENDLRNQLADLVLDQRQHFAGVWENGILLVRDHITVARNASIQALSPSVRMAYVYKHTANNFRIGAWFWRVAPDRDVAQEIMGGLLPTSKKQAMGILARYGQEWLYFSKGKAGFQVMDTPPNFIRKEG